MTKKRKDRVIKSMVLCMISSLYSAFMMSFAWFLSKRSVDNDASSFTMAGFTGDMYYLNDDYIIDSSSTDYHKGYEKGQLSYTDYNQGESFINARFTKRSFTSSNYKNPFGMKEILPNVRYCYLFRIKAINQKEAIGYFSMKYVCSSVTENQSLPKDTDNDDISLSRAVNIYMPDSAYTLSQTKEIYEFINGKKVDDSDIEESQYEKFHKDNKNYSTTQTNDFQNNTSYLLHSLSVSDEYVYVPIVFEFSGDDSTLYKYDSETGLYEKYSSGSKEGYNSNVYKMIQLDITYFSISNIE